jgi:hypothetical protein
VSTPLSPRAELARALRELNRRFHELPEADRPAVEWGQPDDRLEAALASGDRERALTEIERWHDGHVRLFEAVAR